MSLTFSIGLKEFQCIYLILFSVANSEAKTYSRCELADALRARGLTDTANWVCLVESESGRRTNAVGQVNPNGSRDYGLFQINNHIWCNQGGRGCGLPCNSLIDDNIDDDVACAKAIYRAQGFGAWYGWKAKCRGSLADYQCPGEPPPSGNPCTAKGGQCKNKNQCSNPQEKIDGQWGCPNDPADVWCCLGGGGGSPCANKGGQCKNKNECSNPQEKIDGQWSCPNDPKDIWCCLNNGGGGGSPCARDGGQCKNRFQCSGTAVEKINGAWSCPNDPKDVWCCK